MRVQLTRKDMFESANYGDEMRRTNIIADAKCSIVVKMGI